jgi:glycosyltransferase involved in cell wall biosynthesis
MKFDIILPTVGRPSVFTAIDSVNKQEYPHWNLWVICDGVKELIGPNNANVSVSPLRGKIIGSPFNSHDDNGTWARNEGIKLGNAEWIAYIDDDDELLPNHLTTLVECARLNPDATMLKTAGQSFKMGHKHPRSSKLVRKLGPINTTDHFTVGMAHTRDIYNRTLGWRPVDNHDHLLWFDMLLVGGIPAETDAVTFLFKR